ncbi:MAG: hypothetical protein A3F53_02650 [Candidatus Zambryskibacteria bacterium RIFCSPHIGHO2_12_FULL_48_10]|nr:MAG: hypothetical protein A3F53_02650 [Candidatus Zambryskibacteria bacterium RIFCSPHIGHO2_12_FULL_48_10]OHB06820.1 MAG: hypothetical protein A3A31_00740 [Candidatus Zambryskibacteria bacterium RIFCSPLOWO2_01_FULL_48_25]
MYEDHQKAGPSQTSRANLAGKREPLRRARQPARPADPEGKPAEERALTRSLFSFLYLTYYKNAVL